MVNQDSIDDWFRMFTELTDPEERAKSRARAERDKRRLERIADTGL